MITRTIEFIGVFIITLFCATSIFFAIFGRDFKGHPLFDQISAYTSFFEDRFYDLRMIQSLNLDGEEKDHRLVLAAIDDESLETIGRWPWSRTAWAEFMDQMDHFGARVIAFDVFFTEPELARGEEISPDEIFSQSISRFQAHENRHVILPYAVTEHPHQGFEEIPFELYMEMLTAQSRGENLREQYISRGIFPVEELLFAEPMLGFISSKQDPDGIFRHYPLVVHSDGNYFPSYSLRSYEAYTNDNSEIFIDSQAKAQLQTKQGQVDLNFHGEVKIRWFGGMNNFPIIGIDEILSAPKDSQSMRDIFEDTIVFVGSTAFAAHDLRHTPIDSMLPGVIYHMNMTKMLLDGHFLVPQERSTRLSWLILIVSTLIMLLIMMMRNPIIDFLSIIILVTGTIVLDVYWLTPQGYEIKLFFALLSPVASYSWITVFNFYLTNKEKKAIRGTFSRYVAPAIVDQMLSNPDKVKVGGEKKNITVFFSDIRDFTNISEKLSPEELSICLNQYMGVMTDILFENQGTLDKYIGDMIVAYWGAPLEIENHAYHGVKTAVEMMKALPGVNQRFREQGFPEFKHGMGLNTGDCSVGNMGSDKIFSYTALGDTMNLGARAESLCKYYGVEINITENTKNAIPEELQQEFQFRILDKVRVKGKEEPVILWEVLYPDHPLWDLKDILKSYHRAFDHYMKQEFVQSKEILTKLHEEFPKDKCFKRVLDSCQAFIEMPPPPDWDGVFTHTSKG